MSRSDLIDTHFHLEEQDDLAQMVTNAKANGIVKMVLASASIPRIAGVLEQIQAFPDVYAAAGVHPHEADKYDGNMQPYREYHQQPKVVAVGEIGLDYFYDYGDQARQRTMFGDFLDLAVETGRPAIIHCREAEDDCLKILNDRLPAGHPFVIHCFTGTVAWAERFLERGAHLSFTGILTFGKAENVRDALKVVPLDRLMFETDSPYLAPKPYRGKRNEPAHVRHVVSFAADVLGIEFIELAEATTRNAIRFFGLED